jgi:hypothetical protein
MMELALIIYLVSLVDSVNNLAVAFVILFFVAVSVSPFAWMVFDTNGDADKFWPMSKRCFLAVRAYLIAAILILVFLPSEKTAYTMLAAYGVQHVAENPQVQELAGDSLKVLNKAMKEYLADDEPAKTEEVK